MAATTSTRQASFLYNQRENVIEILNIGVKTDGWTRQYKFNVVIPLQNVKNEEIIELAARELGRRYQASLRSCSENFVSGLPHDRTLSISQLAGDNDGTKDLYNYVKAVTGLSNPTQADLDEWRPAFERKQQILAKQKEQENAGSPETVIRKKKQEKELA